ncbi:MAG: chemotaxis protein CheW [Xanthobacteraceae bacterium]
MPDETTAPHERRQFIAFLSGNQQFAADIMAIREIRGWSETTPLPHAPDYVRGAINLRGIVLPVVDLNAQLGRGLTETSAKHAIIVVAVAGQSMGLLVDAVSDILTVKTSDIQPSPDLARAEAAAFIEGIAVLGESMVTILSMQRMIESLSGDAAMAQAA